MPGWLANLAGAGAAVLVVGAGMFLGDSDVAANGPSNPMRLSAPPATNHGSGEVPVGEALELWGRPARLNMFWTSDSTDEIIRTYVEAWKAAGFEPQVKRVDRVAHVSFVEPSTGLMRSVTILESGDQRTVLPGLTDIRVAPDLSAARAPVPVPENISDYLAHSADDTTSISYSATYAAPLDPATVMAFYRQEMTKAGYEERATPDVHRVKNGSAIEFQRGPEYVQVVANANDPQKLQRLAQENHLPADALEGKASFVSITHIRQLPLPEEKKP